ncbi:MAG: NUDIX domain-containing protein [Patescibacteria group bacterium]|nr:NUDIX domain-containing protein [Patescibacteria group bacterium]
MDVQKLFIATKAFIVRDGKVLIVRESGKYDEGTNAAKYDVVGGRLKPGERFDESLRREVREETGLDVKIGKPFFVNEWRPVVKDEQWQIVGMFFECVVEEGEVKLSGDHDAYEWIDPAEYQNYPLIENLKVAFEAYLARK